MKRRASISGQIVVFVSAITLGLVGGCASSGPRHASTEPRTGTRKLSTVDAKDYLQTVKKITVLIEEPFECADALRIDGERVWAPLVSPDEKARNKETLSKAIADAVRTAGYGEAGPAARLLVHYEDQRHTGMIVSPGQATRAFKKYSMTMRLLTEDGRELMGKTYEEEVEETDPNVRFSFERVLGPARKNAEEFLKALRA
jgi:hypothetical protein